MGTSKSSSGSPSSVPMVPPWVPDPESDDPQDQENSPEANEDVNNGKEAPVAPAGRFGPTRTSLGHYASSGDQASLRKGVGRYFGGGLGGSGTAVRRFGGTASNAGALYGALGGTGTGSEAERARLDRSVLEGASVRKIVDVLIETVCPVDGSQDTEASRNSINDAMSELLKRFPDADILALNEDQRIFVVQSYVSMDVYRRFVLDVGNAIREKAPNPTTALSRLKQARDYIRQHISASFKKLRDRGTQFSGNRVSRIVNKALNDAFDVFSGYAE